MLLWLLLLVAGLALAVVRWRSNNRKLLAISQELPGPPTLPLVGNALMFLNVDITVLFKTLTAQYGTLVRFWLGLDLNIIASDPEDVRILLSSSKLNEKGVQYKYMRAFLGEGILSGSGPIWKRHRKIANPNFSKRSVEGLTDLFNEESNFLIEKLQGLASEDINMYTYVVQATSYTVCRSYMGLSREDTMKLPHLQDVIDLSPNMYDSVFSRMTQWWKQIDPVYRMSSAHKLDKEFLSLMDSLFGVIIRKGREKLNRMGKENVAAAMNSDDPQTSTQISVVDRLILSEELDLKEMVQEGFTLFTASQEATAKITSFLLLMMAYHPDCQERLHKEILEVVGEEAVTEEHLRQMPYLEMAFKETIRLFPIGVALQRKVIEDIAITKTTIPAGCSLVIPIFHIQRDPRYWKNPDAFDPDRFTPENSVGRPAYAYIPFSLGPMDCLGRHFGTKLVKTIAIKVLQNYKITSNQSYKDLKLNAAISVKSVHGYHGILTPRSKSSETSDSTRKFSTNLQQHVIRQHGLKI